MNLILRTLFLKYLFKNMTSQAKPSKKKKKKKKKKSFSKFSQELKKKMTTLNSGSCLENLNSAQNLFQYFLGAVVFTNGHGDLGSILGRVIPKTQKMVLDATLLNTQHYKVKIKGKVKQSRERSSTLSDTLPVSY